MHDIGYTINNAKLMLFIIIMLNRVIRSFVEPQLLF